MVCTRTTGCRWPRPDSYRLALMAHSAACHGRVQSCGVSGILLVTTVLVIGIKESANFNSAIVFVKLAAVLIFIAVAGNYVMHHMAEAKANWTPFIPPNTGTYGIYGWSGIAREPQSWSSSPISALTRFPPRRRKPKIRKKDMPIGILGSLAICTVLYIVVLVAADGCCVTTSQLNVAAPVSLAIVPDRRLVGKLLVNIGAICRFKYGDAGHVAGAITRLLFHVARRPAVEVGWRNSSKIPYALEIQDLCRHLRCIFCGPDSRLAFLARLVSIGTLLAFVIVCAGVWVLRAQAP